MTVFTFITLFCVSELFCIPEFILIAKHEFDLGICLENSTGKLVFTPISRVIDINTNSVVYKSLLSVAVFTVNSSWWRKRHRTGA